MHQVSHDGDSYSCMDEATTEKDESQSKDTVLSEEDRATGEGVGRQRWLPSWLSFSVVRHLVDVSRTPLCTLRREITPKGCESYTSLPLVRRGNRQITCRTSAGEALPKTRREAFLVEGRPCCTNASLFPSRVRGKNGTEANETRSCYCSKLPLCRGGKHSCQKKSLW